MASFNRVILLGNLTRDPELRYIPSGTAVVEVGVAINERHKNAAGELVEDVNFIDLVFWSRTAEVVNEYCKKGSPILVEGRLKQDVWDAEDGTKRSKIKVVCEKMQLLGTKNGGATTNDSEEATAKPAAKKTSSKGENSIPF